MDQLTLDKLRDKYWNIYQTTTEDGNVFIWRELSRAEWNKAVRYFPDPYDREDYVCKVCIIERDESMADLSTCKAGITSSLAQKILQESGFSSDPTGKIQGLMRKFDDEMSNFQHQVSCIITEGFPQLNIEDVEDWPLEKTMWYYSRARYKLEELRGLELIQESGGEQQQQVQNGMAVSQGDGGDFPELAAERAFMKGR